MEVEKRSPQQIVGPPRVSTEAPWWSGVVMDSISGFSAMLVFILGGILLLRRWNKKRRAARD